VTHGGRGFACASRLSHPCRDFLLRVQHAGFSLEGIVSKRKDSPYRSGRRPDWLKMKNPACTAVKPAEQEDQG
jgi:ATP-dependent DNA ligase